MTAQAEDSELTHGFSSLEVTDDLNKKTFWTFGRRVVKAQTDQVDLNEI